MLYEVDRAAVILKPTEKFLHWLNDALSREGNAVELTLPQLQANCRVFLVAPRDTPEEIIGSFGARFSELFQLEVATWIEDKKLWPPKMTLETFWEFFTVEVLDEVLDLEDAELTNTALLE